MKYVNRESGIPVSPLLSAQEHAPQKTKNSFLVKTRLLQISALCIIVAVAISIIARFLVMLINVVTNLSFYGTVTTAYHSPAGNHLGLWVVIIPVIGGLLVGLMALYGSKAIRGHGIPEAMEQILVNESRIKPSITFLKPISSAIAIGTGGPFGAEGPIIATGGALGSSLGQLFKITSNERKIILAAGATAGMSAIFGTPIAAIFLAIELLLFEFSPRAILPVALACITGAAGHHLLFGSGPVFPMPELQIPLNIALAVYSSIGIAVGFLSLGVTKIVYFIEDVFEKLPIHWMWWPAIGGLAVGVIGYFAPHTLGVGYDNIISVLSGTVAVAIVVRMFFFKFLSWAIALGSGTSGGTLAPLLTIGGAGGALLGAGIIYAFPNAGINIPMAALIGMSAMFAGASRAYLTSITFALESTGQFHALLPLLGACTASYMVSFFLMENTIMTEKIARRGVVTPDSYEPDVLRKLTAAQAVRDEGIILDAGNTIRETRDWVKKNRIPGKHFIVAQLDGSYLGTVSLSDLTRHDIDPDANLLTITHSSDVTIKSDEDLHIAIKRMSEQLTGVSPVVQENKVIGLLSFEDIINAYKSHSDVNEQPRLQISLKRQRLKMVVQSKAFSKAGRKGEQAGD
ncbi:MAG: chloride channel protein [Bacteroidota bacterium]|nr:chloride channel protein [Bacteroidota bacterium]